MYKPAYWTKTYSTRKISKFITLSTLKEEGGSKFKYF